MNLATSPKPRRATDKVELYSVSDYRPDQGIRSAQIIDFTAHRATVARSGSVLKRALDITGALIGLIFLSPIFLLLAALVKRDGGPVFYGQRRVGCGGVEFRCWKFRSMVPNADRILESLLADCKLAQAEWDQDFKLKNDPRITRIGGFLRKTSLDELPQLINVLLGQMSLVGPRPITRTEMAYYGQHIGTYLAVNPGITGLWQVSGRNDVTYDERVALDVSYVRNWSFLKDIVILFKTVKVMAMRSGAY